MMEWTRDLPFSRSYLVIVIAVVAVVSGLALFGQSSTLALAAAILGLYVLHLFSNWQLASNQRQQWQTLREVERMLGALDGEQTEPAPGPAASGPAGVQEIERPPSADAEERHEPTTEANSDGESAAGGVSAETSDSGVPAAGAPATAREDGGSAAGAVDQPEEEEDEDDEDTVLVPRQYRLGTVAVVRRVLTPGEVARVLALQDPQSDRKFGDIALDLDLLTEEELQDLLEVQSRGLYRPESISRARRDLKQYQRQKAEELGTGP